MVLTMKKSHQRMSCQMMAYVYDFEMAKNSSAKFLLNFWSEYCSRFKNPGWHIFSKPWNIPDFESFLPRIYFLHEERSQSQMQMASL